jgi:5-dehydro-2-deoxygluconokinase
MMINTDEDKMSKKQFDLFSIGRVSMDLFARQIGAAFEDVKSFDASVGGSPVNIAIGGRRLGLRTGVFTAVGEDRVGDFVLRYLSNEGVDTQFVHRKPGSRTGLAIVAVQPPDQFPLVFYRDNPADIHISVEDAKKLPFDQMRAFLISGTALSQGACRDAVLYTAESCRKNSVTTFMDLDLRPDQWPGPLAFGLNIRTVLPYLNVIIGTEEEFCALLDPDPSAIMAGEKAGTAQRELLPQLFENLFNSHHGVRALVIKRGERGVSVYQPRRDPIDSAGFSVEILNTVGAGDAFASGLIYGFLEGWDWQKCCRLGNACGALTVTRHGCSAVFPNLPEAIDFIDGQGGF